MHEFIVTIACLAHMKACPIPEGAVSTYPAKTVQECQNNATKVIAAFGYKATDFRVKCSEK